MKFTFGALVALSCLVAGSAQAQQPNLNLIVGFAPGGSNDIAARIVAPYLSEALGTTVVVATHDLHLLQRLPGSLIMRLDKGRLSDPTGALRYPPRREGAPL